MIVDPLYKVKNKFNFAIANPLYATQNKERTYVFAHGTHFKSTVTKRNFVKKIIRNFGLDRMLIRLNPDLELNHEITLIKENLINNFERIISSFVDSVWASSGNNPTSIKDHLWNIFNLLRGKFDCEPRESFKSELFSISDLKTRDTDVEKRIKNLNGKDHKSLDLFKDHFLYPMLFYLKGNGLLNKNNPLTFVYGDTHNGGYGELKRKTKGRSKIIRIYNLGSWVVHGDKHPACHIFAVDKEGKEYLLNVSIFGQKVLGESLLILASKDAENRTNLIIRVLDSILSHIPEFLKKWIGSIIEKLTSYISS